MNEMDLLKIVAKAYNNLDYKELETIASDDIVYESQDVFSALEGKKAVLNYLQPKFETVKNSGHLVFAEIGYIKNQSRSCIIMSQGTLENKISVVLIESRDEKLSRIDICTIFPHWSQVTGTNEYPV